MRQIAAIDGIWPRPIGWISDVTRIGLKPSGHGPIKRNMHTNVRSARATIASFVNPRTFAPGARSALRGLGYEVVTSAPSGRVDATSPRPVLMLVDERRFEHTPGEASEADTPIVLVGGARGRRIDDARIVGCTARPIEVDALYPILQRMLERTPRATPRVATRLTARGMREDRRWEGRVTSLSAGGCYFLSDERPPIGAALSLQVALPRQGVVTARAVCTRVCKDGAGLAFTASSEEARREIDAFVSARLAAA